MKLYVLSKITTIGETRRKNIGIYHSEEEAKLIAMNYLTKLAKEKALSFNESTLCVFNDKHVCQFLIDEVECNNLIKKSNSFYELTKEDLEYVLDNNFSKEEKNKILKNFSMDDIMDILSVKIEIDWIEPIETVLRNKCL